MKDERAIAFITCVNDEAWYAECLLYLRHLRLPEGFRAECIAVRGAASMAAGYNEGMARSRARYKVYLHQDTLLVNKDFPRDSGCTRSPLPDSARPSEGRAWRTLCTATCRRDASP